MSSAAPHRPLAFPPHAMRLVGLGPRQYAVAQRLALPCYLALRCLVVFMRWLRRFLHAVHVQIRDDRYLLGLQLNNLEVPAGSESAR